MSLTIGALRELAQVLTIRKLQLEVTELTRKLQDAHSMRDSWQASYTTRTLDYDLLQARCYQAEREGNRLSAAVEIQATNLERMARENRELRTRLGRVMDLADIYTPLPETWEGTREKAPTEDDKIIEGLYCTCLDCKLHQLEQDGSWHPCACDRCLEHRLLAIDTDQNPPGTWQPNVCHGTLDAEGYCDGCNPRPTDPDWYIATCSCWECACYREGAPAEKPAGSFRPCHEEADCSSCGHGLDPETCRQDHLRWAEADAHKIA